jgi:hypothetical protein
VNSVYGGRSKHRPCKTKWHGQTQILVSALELFTYALGLLHYTQSIFAENLSDVGFAVAAAEHRFG